MKKIILIAIINAVLIFSCGEKKSEVEEQKVAAPKYSLAMLESNVDPDCGMTLTNESIQDTSHYKGKVYGFCSSMCAANFKSNPDAYTKKHSYESHADKTHK